MSGLLKRAGIAVLGLVVMLAWWSFRGGDTKTESLNHIPAKVWEGGAATVEVTVESSGPARMAISFEKHNPDGSSTFQLLETWEKIEAGSHSWKIDVPTLISSYVDLTAENPQVGATLKLTVRVNGNVVFDQSDSLNESLKAGYVFALLCEFDDLAAGTLTEDY